MSDVIRYSRLRAARDAEFADGLEARYEEFKIEVFADRGKKRNPLRADG